MSTAEGLAGDGSRVPTVEIRILGPFELTVNGQDVRIRRRQAVRLLAVLSAAPGKIVTHSDLQRAVWPGDTDVADERNQIQGFVKELRKQIGGGKETFIKTHRDVGYQLLAPPAVVDLAGFRIACAKARQAFTMGAADQALGLVRDALEQWRGRALPDFDGHYLERVALGLDGGYLDAIRLLAAAGIKTGDYLSLIDDVQVAIERYPERVWLRLPHIVALYCSGRLSDAAQACDEAARAADCASPAEKRELTQIIGLVQDGKPVENLVALLEVSSAFPRLPAVAPIAAATQPSPSQLPAATGHFTGRSDQLVRLASLWPDAGAPAALIVSAVDGMAGIGKTALVVHVAHQLASRFPDGVLFLDLRGFTPGTAPTTPEVALDTFLRGLGVQDLQIPPTLDARVALYRSALAGRRALIVLDNAADETQVRSLLPGSPGCLVLITSRRLLTGLDEAEHLGLPVLTLHEGVTLFDKVAGIQTDPAIAEEIVKLCGHLPLAIRIAAAKVRAGRSVTPAALLDQLRRENDMLAVLDDGERSVEVAFAVSYRHLTQQQQHAFRQLGLHPGPDIDLHAAAALLDASIEHTQLALDELEAANLLDQPVADRYTFHDLIRRYAAQKASQQQAQPGFVRLLDHYIGTAATAMDLLYPHERHRRPPVVRRQLPGRQLTNEAQAACWLDVERSNLLAAARHAAQRGYPVHVCDLSHTLWRYLETRALHQEALTVHAEAVRAGRELDDALRKGHALHLLAVTYWRLGRNSDALTCSEEAVAVLRATDDQIGLAHALASLGIACRRLGRPADALRHHEDALALFRAAQDRSGESRALNNLGTLCLLLGHCDEALAHHRQALSAAQASDDQGSAASALGSMGNIHQRYGRYQDALADIQRALEIFRAIGDRNGEILALNNVGNVHRSVGNLAEAIAHHEQALGLARDIGNQNLLFEALHSLGIARRLEGELDAAIRYQERALGIAGELGQKHDAARAMDALAGTHHERGDSVQAQNLWKSALEIFTSLDSYRAEEVRAQLARTAEMQT